jgi:hypothetical protein
MNYLALSEAIVQLEAIKKTIKEVIVSKKTLSMPDIAEDVSVYEKSRSISNCQTPCCLLGFHALHQMSVGDSANMSLERTSDEIQDNSQQVYKAIFNGDEETRLQAARVIFGEDTPLFCNFLHVSHPTIGDASIFVDTLTIELNAQLALKQQNAIATLIAKETS